MSDLNSKSGDADPSSVQPVPSNNSYTQSLKNLLVQCTSVSGSGTDAGSGPRTLTDEDKHFIEAALDSTVRINETASGIGSMIRAMEVMCADHPNHPTEDDISILEFLEEATEDLHNGDEFIAMGGIKLCSLLLDSTSATVQENSCNIVANVASNNPTFQAHIDGNPLLEKLLIDAKSTIESTLKVKLLYAASCIISSNISGVQFLLDQPNLGMNFLFDLYSNDLEVKSRSRTGRIIGAVFRENQHPANLVPQQIITFTNNLLDNWWEENNAFVCVNLQLLNSIYNCRNQEIRKTIRTEFGSKISSILTNMKKLPEIAYDTGLTPDGEEMLNTLKELQVSLESDDSQVSSTPQSSAVLSICS